MDRPELYGLIDSIARSHPPGGLRLSPTDLVEWLQLVAKNPKADRGVKRDAKRAAKHVHRLIVGDYEMPNHAPPQDPAPVADQDIGILFVGLHGVRDEGACAKLTAAGVRTLGEVLALDPVRPPRGLSGERVEDLQRAANRVLMMNAPPSAPAPDTFDENTPPPRRRPVGDPIPRYVVAPPGESAAALFAHWDAHGRIPPRCVLARFGAGYTVAAVSCTGQTLHTDLGKVGETIPDKRLAAYAILAEVVHAKGGRRHVVLAPRSQEGGAS